MGCQTILRYLETLSERGTVGGALFVAGFLHTIRNLENARDEEIGRSWTDAPLNLTHVRSLLPKSIALFSDNDQWVTLDNTAAFEEGLGSEIVVEHQRGHFTEEIEPSVLAAALRLLA